MADDEEDFGTHKKAAGDETETQKILEARKKKNIEEDDVKLKEMEEERRKQREIEEEELQQLKERQERRKKEREAEMKKMDEMRQAAEQRRMQEEEERKIKEEELRKKKQEDAARKKAAAVSMSFIGTSAVEQGNKNFTVNKSDGAGSSLDKFMSLTQVRNEMAFTQDQLEDLKQKTIKDRVKPLELDGMGVDDLKRRAEEMWQQIVKLETSKYDLDSRFLRQEYDLKEMAERQRQMQKQRWAKAGLDPAEDAKLMKFPPKVQTASKYERQIDRRTWGDKREIYEIGWNKNEEKERHQLGDIKLKDESSWIKPKEAYGEKRYAGYADEGLDEEFEPKLDEIEINIPRRSRDEGSSRRKSVEKPASKHEDEEEEEAPRQAAAPAPAAARYTAVDEDEEEEDEEEE